MCKLPANNKIQLLFDDGKEWYKVSSLNEIFTIFNKIGNDKYMLVAGNTAHGILRTNI